MNSRIMNKVEELKDEIEKETGQRPDIHVSLHEAGNFSDVTQKSNNLLRETGANRRMLWADGSCGGMNFTKKNTEFSVYFDQPFSSLISKSL